MNDLYFIKKFPSFAPQHKRIASSGFEAFKHQENIDRNLLADKKLYFDESPGFQQKKEDFDVDLTYFIKYSIKETLFK